MPEGFVRFDTANNTIYEFAFVPIASAAPGEDLASVGQQSQAPDPRLKRYDGANGIRDATAQEIADFDTAKADAEAERAVDEMKALKALVLWLAEKLAITPVQARNEIIAKYKGL